MRAEHGKQGQLARRREKGRRKEGRREEGKEEERRKGGGGREGKSGIL